MSYFTNTQMRFRRQSGLFLVSLLIVCAYSKVNAQSSKVKKGKLNIVKTSTNEVKPLPAKLFAPNSNQSMSLKKADVTSSGTSYFYGQIRMEGIQYLSNIPGANNLSTSQFLSARMSYFKEANVYDFAADISAGSFFIRNQTNLGVHEIFLTGKGFGSKVYIGRKKFLWSELDSLWQLGVWQPHVALDALRPEEESLAGVFYNYQGRDFEVVGVASPLFVPTMGPEIREEDGSLKSDSRWYRPPSNDFNFNGRNNTISYKLDVPEIAKLMNNQGAAVMARVGAKEHGPWVSASTGYKPVNDLLLERRAIKSTTNDVVDVTAKPVVGHHSVYSLDAGYSLTNVKFGVSYLEDGPRAILPQEGWVIQKIGGIKAWSANAAFSMNNVFSRSVSFQLAYMKVNGAQIQDIDSEGKPDDMTLLKQRLKFTDSVMVKTEGQITSWLKKPIVARLKWLYDFKQKGSILNTEALYYPARDWALVVGTDVLGVQDEKSDPDGFLNQFRANDRFYGGITYVY